MKAKAKVKEEEEAEEADEAERVMQEAEKVASAAQYSAAKSSAANTPPSASALTSIGSGSGIGVDIRLPACSWNGMTAHVEREGRFSRPRTDGTRRFIRQQGQSDRRDPSVLGSTLSLGEANFLFFAQANSQKCRFRYGSKNRPKTERPALFRLFAQKNDVICMSKQSKMKYHFFHENSQNAAWSSLKSNSLTSLKFTHSFVEFVIGG